MKTDLKLLLECLKFQMDNPELQKDTVAAIRSICQSNSDACNCFREIGGLIFIISLAKCSTHLILKEVSLYTLGVLAESNVFCQQALCTLELFEDVSTMLSDDRSSVSLKRMSVFLVLALVSNNKAGQAFVRESGCIDLLLLLFSSSTVLAEKMLPSVDSVDPQYQLWLSVCSALCATVNNPQNEENQKLCTSAFPQSDKWLRYSIQPEIVRPVCSLIGLSVANNRFSQDYFVSLGGLDTLANVLLQLVNGVQTERLGCNLAVVVSKTLDACITENPRAVHHLSKYSIVSSLITLLSNRRLAPEDRFSIVLTLGHCTENCEPNQYELLKSNGLPLMIQVLTESQDDEIHKAATFVLQNCRHITEMLSLSVSEHSPNVKQASTWNVPKNFNDEFWKKAKEIYHKLEYLQQQNNEDIADIEEPAGTRDRSPTQMCKLQTASAMSRLPFLNSHSKQQNAMTLCADIIDKEISSILDSHIPQTQLRCSGCLVTGLSMNSRNCNDILQKCPHLCDRHRVILQTEERYKGELRKLLRGARISTPHNSACLRSPARKMGPSFAVMVGDVMNLRTPEQTNSKRGTRKDFTKKEITDLLDGVRKFGRHWNTILWSYPFQKGRTNVDLAKKYKQLQM
ncbi:PREDICTED: telomere repeats-binding bouquet formation protein 1 [Nanorana parkeri]|uniref:telomere repeats-binding bouquet formation protein 1 n=1 Tax=Nanorana parkeri TaxID=125878 RepID=UPI0008540796|nr:PREDICTED: telomere repeats-binding bouquet formation protein 1 [Nanorana parkeri]